MPGRGAAVLMRPSLQTRSVVRRMGLLALLLVATLSGATVGYVIIEDFGWLDAAYMAVITVSTVGF